MKNFLYSILLILFSVTFFSQNIKVNQNIDTTIFKSFAAPLDLWLDFLHAESDSVGSKYWNQEELDKYGVNFYLLLRKPLGCQDFHKVIKRSETTIIDISQAGDVYKIKTLIAAPDKDKVTSRIVGIFNIHVKKENGSLKLYNALVQNTKDYFNTTTIGFINFHYPKTHQFNKELAKKQSDFYLQFSHDFDVPIYSVDYYFTANNEELLKLKGFDFSWGDVSNNIPSGVSYVQEKLIFTHGVGEYFPHEFVHILVTPIYYWDCHDWFDEGLATYYGMSRGKDLDWHLKRLIVHLNAHPEINLNSMTDLSAMDDYTNFSYSLGGYFMKKAFEKGGIPLQKKFLVTGKENRDFYNTIEKYLGIKKENLNEAIRRDLNELYLKK